MYRMYLTLSVVVVATVSLAACINIDINLFGADDTPVVKVDDTEFEVEVADTPLLRRRGLTGRRYLEERMGMLFIPDERYVGPFWMTGMLFPLDIIWIGSDCRVADVTVFARVPEPGTPDDMIRRYTSYPRAAFTLEVNAGEIDRFGIRVGDKVEFDNINDRC